MGHRRDYQPATIFEPNKAPVEQVIDAGGQQQPVFAIQSLYVGGIPPGLAMARNQVDRVLDARYSTLGLNLTGAVFKKPLPLSGFDQGRAFDFGYRSVIGHLPF